MTVSEQLTVLIVEDDVDHADILAEFLTQRGHVAIVARSASDALAQVDVQPIDLVLVDLVLPDMEGHELVARMRALGVACRIVATTGYPSKPSWDASYAAGVNAVLLKPFALARVEAELARVNAADDVS